MMSRPPCHSLLAGLFLLTASMVHAQTEAAPPVVPIDSTPAQAATPVPQTPASDSSSTQAAQDKQALQDGATGSASTAPSTTPSPLVNDLSAPPPPAAAPASSGAVNGDYILKPGDTIELIVYREQDLNIRSRIGKDGMVQLPLLGEVKLGGMSVRNATAMVRQKYDADYLVAPQIYLNIASYNTRKFTIIGQVGRPGAYEFSGGDDLGLLEAIGMAGGFTRIADRGHVMVKRREGDKIRTVKVNAKKLSDAGIDQFKIEPGDVINVGESWY
jgi:polysaccharide export outer membrane protein